MMATHGRGGSVNDVAIGSVAERVVQETQCPVFLVPIQDGRQLQALGPPLS